MALTKEQLEFLEEIMYEIIGNPFFSFGQRLDKLKEISQPFISEEEQIEKIKEFSETHAIKETEYQSNLDEKKLESEEKQQKYEGNKFKI